MFAFEKTNVAAVGLFAKGLYFLKIERNLFPVRRANLDPDTNPGTRTRDLGSSEFAGSVVHVLTR